MQSGIKKLILAGGGHAHVHVLSQLAEQRPADLDVILVSPYPWQTYSGMVPGFVAGRYEAHECQIPLEPLVKAAGARWVPGRVTGIDAQSQAVRVETGPANATEVQALYYDRLSLDIGGVMERERLEQSIPGAASHALLVRPIEVFATLWPKVVELGQEKPVSLAVIGAGAAGIELIFAAEQRFRQTLHPGSRFTLITGGGDVGEHYSPGVRKRILGRLRSRGITVLREACTAISAGQVQLSGGASLACDAPILAISTHAPGWLRDTDLALAENGLVQVNEFQQSISHPNVFAVGDVSVRVDAPHPRSGVFAVRAGPPLYQNLMAAHENKPLKPYQPQRHSLNLISCGAGHAIASYGPFHAEGGWAWLWKDHIDRAFMDKYTLEKPPAQPSNQSAVDES